MPLLKQSSYQPPFYLKNPHGATILPSLLRRVNGVLYDRERIDTEDGDFLDLDWIRTGSDRLCIVSHGLEGSSERHYVKGMAKHLSFQGYDVLAWNCRSCSGELNRKPRFYHHADIDDLSAVIQHALTSAPGYHKLLLVGFSMGGSLTLNYLGRVGSNVPEEVKGGVVFSVPCDLASSCRELEKSHNAFYLNRFLRKLRKKVEAKAVVYPEIINADGFETIRSFADFDNRYTAPLHGFEDAADFYNRASAVNHLEGITRPTLIVNAANDPFLAPPCYPEELIRELEHVYLEIPHFGGHVGFSHRGLSVSWMELRSAEFIREHILT